MQRYLRVAARLALAPVLLAGCGGSLPNGVASPTTQIHEAGSLSYHVVYRFGAGGSGSGNGYGAMPLAGLVLAEGYLYGTTTAGGAEDNGTVFSIKASGAKQKPYRQFSFGAYYNGDGNKSSLIDVNGTLYGTTSGSDFPSGGDGTLYSIDPILSLHGAEQVLHVFDAYSKYPSDGKRPRASVIFVNGRLYGTTEYGGSGSGCKDGCGTVFSASTTGAEQFVYSFTGGSDGSLPEAPLIHANGMLYGTTSAGGTNDDGTVFSISTSGKEKVLYSFAGGSDGQDPVAGLTNVKGTLYGTTSAGGTHNDGTVFSINTGGKEKVLYNFAGGSDGQTPVAGLIDVNGTFYGTTSAGGTHNDGTVFSIGSGGKETVVYSFAGRSDGKAPTAGLTDVNGTLYGTTSEGGGGCYGYGCGIIYTITP